MPILRKLQSAIYAVGLRSGVWSAGAGGFALTGSGFRVTGQPFMGWVAIGLGLAMFVWGLTIYGRNLWEPWWRGPIKPVVNAFLLDHPYQADTVINGIEWDPDFSHVHVRIANPTKETMSDFNFVIYSDRHIIKSACRATFAACTIGPESRGIGQITLIGIDCHRRKVAITGDQSKIIEMTPCHRLICEKLPIGAEIDIDLAIVTPQQPPASKMWARGNPTRICIEGTYSVRSLTQYVGWMQTIGKAAQ